MLQWLNGIDHALFLSIHHFRCGFLDAIMPWLSNRWIWIPFYLLLAFLTWKLFGRQVILIAVTIGLLIVASDQSADLLKNNVCRLRPCHDPQLAGQVITPEGCGGPYGFVSGHAANTFAVATFFWLLSGISKMKQKRKYWLLLYGWATLVCWSRIYLGVHFPLDVICGAMLGTLWATLFFMLYLRFTQRTR